MVSSRSALTLSRIMLYNYYYYYWCCAASRGGGARTLHCVLAGAWVTSGLKAPPRRRENTGTPSRLSVARQR